MPKSKSASSAGGAAGGTGQLTPLYSNLHLYMRTWQACLVGPRVSKCWVYSTSSTSASRSPLDANGPEAQ